MTVEPAVVTNTGLDARTLVSQLVGDELASLAADVRDGRSEHALRSLDQRGMAQQLIREQYSGRYPFELLQNANDAAAARLDHGGSKGLGVRFIVGEKALLVADQGIGFGADEVRAICGLGRSSKDPRKSVGYKGLGFKSVGEICEKPQIITPDLMFGFDSDRVRREIEEVAGQVSDDQLLPTHAFPFLLDHSNLGDDAETIDDLLNEGFRTVLRLPFKPGISHDKVVVDVLSTIRPQLLLFLPATGRLEVMGTDHDFIAASDRESGADHEVVLLDVDGQREIWHVFVRQLTPPSAGMMSALGDAWVEVEAVHAGAAVRLDEEGRPDASSPYPLNVYFPTEEKPGLPLMLQADFALDLDRRFVKRTPEAHDYNTWLADELARLIGEVVAPSLARSFPDDGRVIDVVSPRSVANGFGAELAERVVEHLRTSRFISCIDGQVRIPGEALLLPDSLPNAFAALRLMDTENHGRLVLAYAQKRPHTRRLLEERLEVAVLDEEETLWLLASGDPETLDRLYDLLVEWSPKIGRRFPQLTRDIPLVLTRSDTWRAPSDGLFFPRAREDPEIFDELPVEVAVVPAIDGARELLATIGVKTFRWREILEERVLTVLADPDAEASETEPAWKLLRAYFLQQGGDDQEVARRAHDALLPAVSAKGGEPVLAKAGELYFSPKWLAHDRLTQIYGPFAKPEFLADTPPADLEEREAEFRFLQWLGVADGPRVFTAHPDQRDTYMWGDRSRHPHRRFDNQLWQDWAASPEVMAASVCSQNHSASQQLRTSYHLDRITELVTADEVARLAAFFVELRSKWSVRYVPALEAAFYCQNKSHTGSDRQRQVPSLLAFALTTLSWVPTIEDDRVALVPPAQAWRLSAETPRRVAGVVPALPADLDTPQAAAMCFDLGVVDGARASAHDLIRLLHRLADRHADSPEPDSDLFETARWAVGHLNDALDRDAQLPEGLGDVPLPALKDGEIAFTTDPYFCDDAELRQAWPDVAILDAGRELRRLRTALALKDLAKEVETRPRPVGLDDELSERLTAEFRRAAPYLAAAAFDASPSRADTIFARLPRIEVVACEELGLSYTMGEEERTRDSATSFLEGRTVGSGQRRTLGTAYLEVDLNTRRPAWYAFGPQLAEFVDVGAQRDAFALILEAEDQARRRYLASRGIDEEAVAYARQELAKRSDESDFEEAISRFSPWDIDLAVGTGEDLNGAAEKQSQLVDGELGADGVAATDPEAGDRERREDLVLPPIDVEGLELEEAPHVEVPADLEPHRRGGTVGASRDPIDWERVTRVTREVGRWGEELVYELERRRVATFGHDQDGVIWRSRQNELSPYDIRSLDADGQIFYIEVKTTTQTDEHTPFEISAAELAEAFAHRDRYHIYRVLGAGSGSHRVINYDDPAGRLLNGEGAFRFTSGRLYLAPPEEV